MRFNCGLTLGESWELRKAWLSNWHTWFAWYPIPLADGECAWLEKVRRKGTFHAAPPYRYPMKCGSFWTWEYNRRFI